ncbi:hypothetical protein F2Q68_00016102 [Brassica cretica]|uniref:Uncharacterized protein n=1 Tax=Brassica cretica TaxID=69181 RepID=A0A8S9HJ13_BRACR|nr:hypothetical protein F2Q68_00016102 [Brassica cretica]
MNGSINFLHTQNRAYDQPSIDEIGAPSIDGHRELGGRTFDQNRRRRLRWERRDEYDIYRDENGYARAAYGIIIHVSRENIRAILERAAMVGHTHISLPEYAELDDVYYPLNDSIERLTTRMDELKEEIDMIRRQNAILSEASIDGLTRALIDGRYTHLQGKLVIMKLLEDKLDEINFSQDLMREDAEETIYAKLRMQQGCIGNLQNRMHVIGVDKEVLKNQWTRGDEAIRSFIGTWFQMSKDDVDT